MTAGLRWPGLRWPLALFSLNSAGAVLLALWIGFRLDLPRPYWAMLTAYIVAQPLTGALRSKAVYRVIGTAVGGAAAVLIVPAFVNAPELLALVMALWAGLCLFLSLLDRTPRAYAFMLSGYTAAIIGFPSVSAPEAVFTTALARVEEITLGIVCATVVHSLVFPRDVSAALNGRIAGFLADARTAVADALAGLHGPAERRERRRLAERVTELHLLATHLPFDTASLRPRARAVRALQDRLAILLPLLSGVEDRLDGLRAAGALPPELAALAADASAWARSEAPPRGAAAALQARCRALRPRVDREADWPRLLQLSALVRLEELVAALRDARDLAAFVRDPRRRPPAETGELLRARRRPVLHTDPGLALVSAAALVIAVLLCCALWILTAWPEGAGAAVGAAVFASFYATQDDPAPSLKGFLFWNLASLPMAGVYVFAILPQVDSFPLLAAVLLPLLFVMGYAQGDPRLTSRAMPFILGVGSSLALQETYTATLPGFIGGSLGQAVGIGVTLGVIRLVRTFGAEWTARRLLRRGWRELVALASGRAPADPARWIAATLDRLGLLAPRLALAGTDGAPDEAERALADLRAGLNVIDLRRAAREIGARGSRSVGALLAEVEALYADRLRRGWSPEASPRLLAAVDAALPELRRAPHGELRDQALASLAGLRRNLFPSAAPPAPTAPPQALAA